MRFIASPAESLNAGTGVGTWVGGAGLALAEPKRGEGAHQGEEVR